MCECLGEQPVQTKGNKEEDLGMEMSSLQFHKDNLRHLPQFPDFFVTFRILSTLNGLQPGHYISCSLFLLWPGWPFICERESMDSLSLSFFSLLTGQNVSSHILFLYLYECSGQYKGKRERKEESILFSVSPRSGPARPWNGDLRSWPGNRK